MIYLPFPCIGHTGSYFETGEIRRRQRGRSVFVILPANTPFERRVTVAGPLKSPQPRAIRVRRANYARLRTSQKNLGGSNKPVDLN